LDGAVISGKSWNGGHDATHYIMKSLLVNSLGNAAFALVYGPGYSIFLRTNPTIQSTTAVWALSFSGEPWGIVFGKD
jgi:hypothetical protein